MSVNPSILKYSCKRCKNYIGYGENMYAREVGREVCIYCEDCNEKLSVRVHRVLVTLNSGLQYTSKGDTFNSAWIDAIKFIVKSGEEVNQTVSYWVTEFKGE